MNSYSLGLRTRLSAAAGYWFQKRSSDRFIIAHPRSGSTWLRTILTNILVPEAHSDPEVFNALIRGISVRSIQDVRKLPSPRVLTSHTAYLPGLPKVLYVVRDGRDVLISFYNYSVFRKKRLGRDGGAGVADFSEFLRRYYAGEYGHIWDHHVESWLGIGRARMGERLMFIRYEDLKKSTEGIVEKIVTFFSIDTTSAEISRAVDEASIDNVRKIEKEEWRKKGLGMPDARTSFYGIAKKRNWNDYFSEDEKKMFVERSAKAFELTGYEFDDWQF